MTPRLHIPQPEGRFDEASGLWLVTQRLVSPFPDGKRALEILPGYLSDGASVPRLLWSAVGPRFARDTFAAALPHDGLYGAELVSRSEADHIFLEQLLAIGCNERKARAYFYAVRTCGWYVWMRHTPKSIANDRQFCRVIPFPEPVTTAPTLEAAA